MIYDEPLLPDWSRILPSVFESLVAAMLRRQHPNGFRPDGSGGDGGRDFVVPGPTGEFVYQVKHFPGRLNPARRRQVLESINAVMGSKLNGWALVVPMDPSPAETEWFENATSVLGVPCHWLGLNWLNAELPKHPDLIVAHLGSAGSARARVQDGLSRVGNDIVGLDDVLHAQQRPDSSADLLSPNFSFRTMPTTDGPALVITPKAGASFAFDLIGIERHASKQVADSIRFGERTRFVAPAQMIGIPDSLTGQLPIEWMFSGVEGPPFEARLQAIANSGRVLGELRFDPSRPTIGVEGAQIRCLDRSGWVSMRLRLLKPPDPTITMELTYDSEPSAYPDDLVLLLEFLTALDGATQIGLALRAEGRDHGVSPVLKPDVMTNAVAPAFAAFARDMEVLQRITNVHHPISAAHPDIDPHTINELVRKLNGETIEVHGVLSAEFTRIPEELVAMGAQGSALVVEQTLKAIDVQDVPYPIGLLERVHCSHVTIENMADVSQAYTEALGCEVRFRPIADHHWNVTLVSSDDPASHTETT